MTLEEDSGGLNWLLSGNFPRGTEKGLRVADLPTETGNRDPPTTKQKGCTPDKGAR
jgi:hypothetical protein